MPLPPLKFPQFLLSITNPNLPISSISMASAAVAHRSHYHNKKRINCRAPHSFPPKSPAKNSSAPKNPTFTDELSFSELWAGPAYSSSPPPSSLPIPRFSLPQKSGAVESRAVDSSSADFFVNTASATENLRRILNL